MKHKLFQLLEEMLQTERRYVQDLEQAWLFYAPLAASPEEIMCKSLDRRDMKKKPRSLSLSSSSSTYTSCTSELQFNMLAPEETEGITKTE